MHCKEGLISLHETFCAKNRLLNIRYLIMQMEAYLSWIAFLLVIFIEWNNDMTHNRNVRRSKSHLKLDFILSLQHYFFPNNDLFPIPPICYLFAMNICLSLKCFSCTWFRIHSCNKNCLLHWLDNNAKKGFHVGMYILVMNLLDIEIPMA